MNYNIVCTQSAVSVFNFIILLGTTLVCFDPWQVGKRKLMFLIAAIGFFVAFSGCKIWQALWGAAMRGLAAGCSWHAKELINAHLVLVPRRFWFSSNKNDRYGSYGWYFDVFWNYGCSRVVCSMIRSMSKAHIVPDVRCQDFRQAGYQWCQGCDNQENSRSFQAVPEFHPNSCFGLSGNLKLFPVDMCSP